MLTLRKWIIFLQKIALRNKPPQKKMETVDPCTDDNKRTGGVPRRPPKGPEYFIHYPKK